MPTRELLSPAQRTQFLDIPAEMSDQMLARYYTLSDDDQRLIKQHRRNHNRLGFAVQLAYLRFPGRTWAVNEVASPLVVSYIANQLKLNPTSIVQYGLDREATRYEHLAELEKVCGTSTLMRLDIYVQYLLEYPSCPANKIFPWSLSAEGTSSALFDESILQAEPSCRGPAWRIRQDRD
jgi:TnpA family transposase